MRLASVPLARLVAAPGSRDGDDREQDASPTSSSPSRRFECSWPWACTTICATSAGVTVSATATTVAQNVRVVHPNRTMRGLRVTPRLVPSVSESAAATAPGAAARATDDASTAPERAGLVLTALIVVAGVANLNLSVANVALPDIGKHFGFARRPST